MRFALAMAAAFVAGCAGRFPQPPYTSHPPSELVELSSPPPPARVESVPARPTSTAVWVDGEWTLRRGRWAWLLGRWVVPRPGETFSPWVVVRGVDGRLWRAAGTWRDAKGNAVGGPTPLAVAAVGSGQIVNASGAAQPTARALDPVTEKPVR